MSERLKLPGTPVNPDDPPSLLHDLARQINELLPDAVGTGGEAGIKWLRARGDKEVARVAEIKADIVKKLGELELERQRLVDQRNAAQIAEKDRHKEANYKNRTERIRAEAEAYERKASARAKIVSTLRELRDLGLPIDASVVTKMLERKA